MTDTEHSLDLSLPPAAPASAALVPAGFAEKAMASLMQLHTQLMDEKERRVDLYRRLMDREQALAEMRMYVKLLEEKVAAASAPPRAKTVAPKIPPVAPMPAQKPSVAPVAAVPTAAPKPAVVVSPPASTLPAVPAKPQATPTSQVSDGWNVGAKLISKASSSWRSW